MQIIYLLISQTQSGDLNGTFFTLAIITIFYIFPKKKLLLDSRVFLQLVDEGVCLSSS